MRLHATPGQTALAAVIYVAFTQKGTGAFTLVNFLDFARPDLFVASFWNSLLVSTGAVAMQLLFGRNGSVNLLLDKWLGFKVPFMEGLNGVVFVQGLHYVPFILVNLSASLRNIDAAMDEAAENLGAGKLRTIRRVVLPLMAGGGRAHPRREPQLRVEQGAQGP